MKNLLILAVTACFLAPIDAPAQASGIKVYENQKTKPDTIKLHKKNQSPGACEHKKRLSNKWKIRKHSKARSAREDRDKGCKIYHKDS